MIAVLKNDYPKAFLLQGTHYDVAYSTVSGHQSLNDPKACRECKNEGRQICTGEDEEQCMLLYSLDNLVLVQIEKFLTQFDGSKAGVKSRCDMMLYGDDKIAFVEMNCGRRNNLFPKTAMNSAKSVGDMGKMAKARQQLSETIEKLCSVPSIEQKIERFREKVALLAFRDKSNIHNQSEVEKQMSVFLSMPNRVAKNRHTSLPHGFDFSMVSYPEEYQW